MKKYQVIGGQYESVWYGESDSLHGAKLIAAKRDEYWDNWQGWHRPSIYLAQNVKEIESKGRILTPNGVIIRAPIAEAKYKYDFKNKKWFDVSDER